MSDTSECPFCNLGQRILKDNRRAVLFLSDPKKTTGHFLVVPKRHVELPWDLSEDELLDIYKLIFFTEKRIIGKLGEGCDIRQNYRPFMKQGRVKVDHLHYHIIPRSNEDNIYQVSEKHDYELWEPLGEEEKERVNKLI